MGAEVGDEHAISLALQRLHHSEVATKQAALQVVCKLMQQSDERLLAEICRLADDSACMVRWNAVRALAETGQTGDDRAIGKLLERLKDESFAVRLMAIQALAKIAEPSDKRVLKALAAIVESRHLGA